MTFKVPESKRVTTGPMRSNSDDGNNGCFQTMIKGNVFQIIASEGFGWQHVSVSLRNRCPIWEEMCIIKDMFWSKDECVVQYHPSESEYVNNHPYCLHLWKCLDQKFPIPDKSFVGVK